MPDTNALRRSALWSWFVALCPQHDLGDALGNIQDVSGDASFRRYFRGVTTRGSWILVDAPPEKEDSRPFLAVQATLQQGGVQVPQVIAADLQQGFMCLQDFGSELLWPALERARLQQDTTAAAALYSQAFTELLKIQRCPAQALPAYDYALLQREVLLFRDWLCEGILGLELHAEDRRLLDAVFALLVQSALAQPRVYVHRDYHSRNLMLLDSGLGVIDFQDAVHGPVSYDLVSLLKDCYISWPAASVESWAVDYLALAHDARIVPRLGEAEFLRSFHLMGVQRHLKAAGIFCRLWQRDGKPGYLQEIPRTLAYITALPADHGVLGEFKDWLHLKVLPGLEDALQAALKQPARRSRHMKVMLLAAGKGTRMLPLTQHTPKPLLQAGGRSLIEHQIRKLKAAGFSEFVINHAWLGQQLEAALGDGSRLGVRIRWSREDEPLETAGGIVQALPLLGASPFAVVNADIWTDYPFARLHRALVPGNLAHLVLVPNPAHNLRGDFVMSAQHELKLRESDTETAHTFSGIAVYHPAFFSAVTQRKYPLLPLLQQAIRDRRASAELFAGEWQDIGTPERLRALDLSLTGATHE